MPGHNFLPCKLQIVITCFWFKAGNLRVSHLDSAAEEYFEF